MARQRGVVKLDGTLDDITFQKTRDGYRAKVKSEVSKSRIESDPNYVRTRENNAEFGNAGKAVKLLRAAFGSNLRRAADMRVSSRLTKAMLKVVQSDPVSDRGSRTAVEGNMELLQGFEFNVYGPLATTVYVKYAPAIDRVTGACTVSFPSFVPVDEISAPAGTTHYRLFSVAAEVDFAAGDFNGDSAESGILPWDNTATEVLDLTTALPEASSNPLFLAVGVEFLQDVNGKMYPLKSGAFNAMKLAVVDGE